MPKIFQRKTVWCVYVFFLKFLVSDTGTKKSMKTTFQKSQTLEKIIKNIPRTVTMYHVYRKSNKSKKQKVLITKKLEN